MSDLTSVAGPGWFRRALTALNRALLGKSSGEYMKQFTGSDQYFDEAIAAQRGWPQQPSTRPNVEPNSEPVINGTNTKN